jgi:zinc transport system permease protein
MWRRMAYFGTALSHAALLGVALGFLVGLGPTWGIVLSSLGLGLVLFAVERVRLVPLDTLLGIVAHGALALGVVVASRLEGLRVDLMGYLFGDVLAVGWADVAAIWVLLGVVLAVLAVSWRSLLAIAVSEEMAAVEGVAVARTRLVVILLLAGVVAVGMKVVGVLLVVALLLVPAATARRLTRSPEAMALAAAALGGLAVMLGLGSSLQWDLPAGPAMVVLACLLFVAVVAVRGLRRA